MRCPHFGGDFLAIFWARTTEVMNSSMQGEKGDGFRTAVDGFRCSWLYERLLTDSSSPSHTRPRN